MVPLSFLINTWPWARLPSLLCHEGPIIYDLGMSHRPWQGVYSSGPSVFFHSVAGKGEHLQILLSKQPTRYLHRDALPGWVINLFPLLEFPVVSGCYLRGWAGAHIDFGLRSHPIFQATPTSMPPTKMPYLLQGFFFPRHLGT